MVRVMAELVLTLTTRIFTRSPTRCSGAGGTVSDLCGD